MATVHRVAESDMTEQLNHDHHHHHHQNGRTMPTLGMHTPFQAAVAVSEPRLPTQSL